MHLSLNIQNPLYSSHKAGISELKLKVILEGHILPQLVIMHSNVLNLQSLYTCTLNFEDSLKTDPSTSLEDLILCSVPVKPKLDKLIGDQDRHF